MHRRITLITAVLFVAFVAACDESTTPLETDGPLLSHKPNHNPGGGDGGGSQDTTYLVDATFRDAADDGLISEDGSSYDASVHDYFSLNAKASATPQKLCLDFHGQLDNDQVGFGDTDPSITKLCDDGFINTATGKYADPNNPVTGEFDPDDTWISQMVVGSVQRPIWISMNYGRADTNWSVRFGKACDQTFFPDRAPIVTRISDSTWTIEATTARVCKSPFKWKGKPQGAITVADGLNMPVFITAHIKP